MTQYQTKPTAGQQSMNRRMTSQEATRLAADFHRQPYSSYYVSTSETTGKPRQIQHADALYILQSRGLVS